MIQKYFKPLSLTWWASFVPLFTGLFLATLPLHGMQPLADTINEITGGLSAYAMINVGIAGIGLRGAIK